MNGTAIPVLMYHSIARDVSPRFRPWAVPPETLEAHLRHLARAGFEPVTVSQLVAGLGDDGPALPARPVVVTFDDGFEDFHSTALPILDRLGFAATVYVTTGLIGGTATWLHRLGEGRRPMMTWAQVNEVARSGVEVGAHSASHPRLDELPSSRAKAEIVDSLHALEDQVQSSVTSFAYPHGYHGPRIRRLVEEAGFTSAVAVRHALSSPADDVLALARIIVGPQTSVAELARLVGGGLRRAPFPESAQTKVWRVVRRAAHAIDDARPSTSARVGGGRDDHR